jgi:hypothetical protein
MKITPFFFYSTAQAALCKGKPSRDGTRKNYPKKSIISLSWVVY